MHVWPSLPQNNKRLNRHAVEIERRWCLNTHQRPWRTSVTIISPFARPSNQTSPISSKTGRKQTSDILENDEGGRVAKHTAPTELILKDDCVTGHIGGTSVNSPAHHPNTPEASRAVCLRGRVWAEKFFPAKEGGLSRPGRGCSRWNKSP